MEPRPAVTSLPSNPSLPSKVPASPAMTDKTSKSNTPKLVKQLVPSNPSLVEKQIKNPFVQPSASASALRVTKSPSIQSQTPSDPPASRAVNEASMDEPPKPKDAGPKPPADPITEAMQVEQDEPLSGLPAPPDDPKDSDMVPETPSIDGTHIPPIARPVSKTSRAEWLRKLNLFVEAVATHIQQRQAHVDVGKMKPLLERYKASQLNPPSRKVLDDEYFKKKKVAEAADQKVNSYIDQLLFGDNGMAETNQQSSSSSSVEQAMSSAQQTKKEVDELVQQMKDVQALMDQLKARPPLRAGPGPSAPPVNQDPGPSGPAAGPSTKRKRKRSHDEPHVVKKIREEMAQVQSDVENTSVDVETYRADVMQQIEDLRIPRQTPPEAVQPIDVEKLKDDIKLVASSLHDQIVRVDDMSLARLHEINAGLSHRVAQLENRRAQREAKINTLLQAVEGLKSQSKPSTQELERLREETLQNVQMQVAEVLERGAKHVQTSLVKKQEELEGWLHNEHRGLQTFVSYLIQEVGASAGMNLPDQPTEPPIAS